MRRRWGDAMGLSAYRMDSSLTILSRATTITGGADRTASACCPGLRSGWTGWKEDAATESPAIVNVAPMPHEDVPARERTMLPPLGLRRRLDERSSFSLTRRSRRSPRA